MPQWVFHSVDWEKWEEHLPNGKVLLCFRHPEGYEYEPNFSAMPGGWIIVHRDAEKSYGFELEKHSINRDTDMLAFMCIMHEMRRKYGGVDDDQ